MFQFHFSLSESIPSITDWLEVIIGAISLVGFYLVYKTFRLQQETFQEQQKITKLQHQALLQQQRITQIEHDRYLREIRPDFKIVFDWEKSKLRFCATNKIALSTEIQIKVSNGVTYTESRWMRQKNPIPVDTDFEIPFKFPPHHPKNEESFTCTYKYEDEVGTKYMKSCIGYYTLKKLMLVGPLLLSDTSFQPTDQSI